MTKLRVFFAMHLALLSIVCSGTANAAAPYPSQAIRWVVPYPPGGSQDIVARIIGARLAERLGQQVVIDNRAGAGNNIGTEIVAKAQPDGYTLLVVNPANAVNASLYQNLSFNFLRDIVPIGGIVRMPNVMEVTLSLPVKSVTEFIAYAKANSNKVNMASSGSGTSTHLSGELFKSMTGTDMLHVPFKGAPPALIELVSGRVHVMFDNLPASIEHIRGGKLRALAVTTMKRAAILPDVPTVADTVPGYEASAFSGMGTPKGTPLDVINRLNREINEALVDPKIRARLAELGGDTIAGSAAEFGNLLVAETEKWAKVVKFSGAKAE